MSIKTQCESDKTVLMFFITENTTIRVTVPIFNFRIIINHKANCATLIIDKKFENLGQKLEYFSMDVTNDPKTDHKFCITNLGYHSIRIIGMNSEVYHFGEKTIIKFPLDKFSVDYNMNIFLDEQVLKKLVSVDCEVCMFDFGYGTNNYESFVNIWKDGILQKIYINQKDIEKNSIIYKPVKMSIETMMNKFINN